MNEFDTCGVCPIIDYYKSNETKAFCLIRQKYYNNNTFCKCSVKELKDHNAKTQKETTIILKENTENVRNS